MSNGIFSTPTPVNEPIKSYAPGSAEKRDIKKSLTDLNSSVIKIPLVIGGEHIYTTATDQIICPHNKSLVLAESSRGGAKEAQNRWD